MRFCMVGDLVCGCPNSTQNLTDENLFKDRTTACELPIVLGCREIHLLEFAESRTPLVKSPLRDRPVGFEVERRPVE